jgi:DNA primase
MSLIADNYLKDLLSRVDIVEVVGQTVTLRRHGLNYFGRCPFHSEKSPSFTVSPQKQFFHCFGCGAHGSAVGFLMDHEGVPFRDAVRMLAKDVGMAPPEGDDYEQDKSAAEVSKSLEIAADYYVKELYDSEPARTYLRQRGLNQKTAQRFQIGFSPAGWQNIGEVFGDYNDPILETSGLVLASDSGRRYDRFRNRIMFPIHGTSGKVLAFGGRAIGELREGEPKYLNSPEIPGFEKGRELYGLYQARQAIKEESCVYVVEGYMDVVMLSQHGVENAVATLGTACTGDHVRKLLRACESIYFCFDGDEAGRKAAVRAMENSLSQVGDTHMIGFIFLPDGMDPDDYVKAHGKEGFDAFKRDAAPLSRFLLQHLESTIDMTSAEGRAKLIAAAKPHLLKMEQAPALRIGVVKMISEKTGLTMSECERTLGVRFSNDTRSNQAAAKTSESASLAKRLIELVISRPDQAARLQDEWLSDSDRNEAALRNLVIISNSMDGTESPAWISELLSRSEFADIYAHAQSVAEELPIEQSQWERVFQDAIMQLECHFTEQQLKKLMIMDSEGKLDRHGRMEFIEMTKRSHELKKRLASSFDV